MSDLLVVLLRASGTAADLRRTTDALRAHTPGIEFDGLDPGVGVGDQPRDTDGVSRPRVLVVGFPGTDAADDDRLEQDLLRTVPEADLVLLQIGRAVGAAWNERLRVAAYADGVIATASAVPAEVLTIDDGPGDGTEAIAAASGSSTALGEPLWGCVYVRRDALNAALAARPASMDRESTTSSRLEDVVLVPGLVHVLASTVVLSGTGRPAADSTECATPGVRRALVEAEVRGESLRVSVDLRCCAHALSGTQVHALNLVSSLVSDQGLRLSVLLPARLDGSVQRHVDALPASVTRLRDEHSDAPRAHVFHRPYQVLTEHEITDVVSRAPRLVLTHQDMILDRTPAYFPSSEIWRGYTAASALSFVAADEVAFFSEHARQEAIRDRLVDPAKTSVVPPGTNHLDNSSADGTRPARLADDLGSEERPLVLVIGNSYFHKNRVFALQVAEEARRRRGWEGALVFAGGRTPHGSSADDERAFLGLHSELRLRFADLGRVSDDEQRWLYRHSAVVLYPTLYEGFGLVPFEAAAAGTPCLYSSRSSVAEYLPAEGALLDLTDVAATAERLSAMLASPEAAGAIVGAIRLAGESLTWDRTAASYASIYRRSVERPVGLALLAGGEVTVGARSRLAANETEWRMLAVSRRVGAVRLLARAVFAVALALRSIVHRR